MRRHIAAVGSALLVVLLAGCAGAGSGGPQQGNGSTALPEAPTCGTDPVVLNAYFETGFDLPFKLSEEFTKQYPNVTWDIKQDQFAEPHQRHAAPALRRQPARPDPAAHDGRRWSRTGCSRTWTATPPGSAGTSGRRRSSSRSASPTTAPAAPGSLYAMGLNYSLTGVFYNKKLAAQIGMTEPPATLAEFDALLAEAKAAGHPADHGVERPASGGGLAFPLQNLMAAYGPTQPINDWIFQKPGATIDTPANLEAAEHLEQWIKAGYFPADVNAIEYTDANARFSGGEGLFIFNGDWEYANLRQGDGRQRRVLPDAAEGRRRSGRRDVGAADLRYRAPRRRTPTAPRSSSTGSRRTSRPARSTSTSAARTPAVRRTWRSRRWPPGSVTDETLAAGAKVAAANGAMDFIANATGAIFAQGWTPELQKMVGGKQDAAGLLSAVQAEYESELEQGS